ncbi:putative E3 ubiquitin-protein ligase WAVH2 [Camellia lanceoleosa]|uniref:E3 ubiquitin-protein ligase WAVH2 n=1 Tax=Camellia lanceoleosa TaxID=1840588 RepID=A0ACC0HUP2_9ERIC|nr:putative E3 ubiquitin-protein ligase WAVH2 [Camellia lanceoleosa]
MMAYFREKTCINHTRKNKGDNHQENDGTTGTGSGSDRSGVDIVMVLDVSDSMEGEKLKKMKIAMLFMIKKLSPIDRLLIVTFNGGSHRLCPLRPITENSQGEIENLVNALVANGGTNISTGLQTGLKVLNERRLTSGRAVGIMLMSDGQQNVGGDAAQVLVGNVPVYTFGFGADHDPRVLNAIANHSMGGTFSDVRNQNNLSIAFSQCLAGLLTVVVRDLKLTVTKVESTILKLSAENYPLSYDDAASSVTVSLGDLYNKEVRKVIVDLLLPPASSPAGSNVLNITYTYRSADVEVDEPRNLTKSKASFCTLFETSHNRPFARGDDPKELRLFATPRMDAYLEQAKSFDEDPRKPLPSVDEDEKQELAAEPLPPMVGGLSYYIQKAIWVYKEGTAQRFVGEDYQRELFGRGKPWEK